MKNYLKFLVRVQTVTLAIGAAMLFVGLVDESMIGGTALLLSALIPGLAVPVTLACSLVRWAFNGASSDE